MKKSILFLFSSVLLLSSCGTYAGSGAYAGGSLGSILGSAIGGIAGGPRGSDIGTIVGMAGGAVIGGAIGNQADQQRQEKIDRIREKSAPIRVQSPSGDSSCSRQQNNKQTYDNQGSGFDSTNSSDDRLYDFNSTDYNGDYSAQQPISRYPSSDLGLDSYNGSALSFSPNLEIVNARFVDSNQDNVINRNEVCKIIFEIVNKGTQAVYDVVPMVVETTGNKHIFISPSIHVEKIDPGKRIRYTAMVKADSRLKPGSAQFCVSVIQGGKTISKVNEFNIPTSK